MQTESKEIFRVIDFGEITSDTELVYAGWYMPCVDEDIHPAAFGATHFIKFPGVISSEEYIEGTPPWKQYSPNPGDDELAIVINLTETHGLPRPSTAKALKFRNRWYFVCARVDLDTRSWPDRWKKEKVNWQQKMKGRNHYFGNSASAATTIASNKDDTTTWYLIKAKNRYKKKLESHMIKSKAPVKF